MSDEDDPIDHSPTVRGVQKIGASGFNGVLLQLDNNRNSKFSSVKQPKFQSWYILVDNRFWMPEDLSAKLNNIYIGTDILEKIVHASNRTYILNYSSL